MNILFLTQVLPYPLDAGPKVRGYYMLRYLSQRHQVTLVSFVRPDDQPEHIAHLRTIAHAVYTVPIRRSPWLNLRAAAKGLLTGLPIVIARDEMPEMAALLRRLTAETRFDAIHADQLSMSGWGLLAARFAPFALRSLRASSRLRDPDRSRLRDPDRPRLLLDAHNAIYRLAERMAAEATGLRRLLMRREAAAFRRYEAAMLRAYDAVLTVTHEDRALLLELLGVRSQESGVKGQEAEGSAEFSVPRITVIPICVDPTRVAPVTRSPGHQRTHLPTYQSTDLPPQPPTILHLGTMFWPPNVTGVLWFAREVLPLVWRQAPDARFVIVGKNPPAEVQALAADPRIVVTGYVADPLPYLAAADAFVVPLFAGGGMRVKIVDAWLWGLPIVSTPIGAEGIAVQDGENILLAANAAAFAAAVLRLLTDPRLNTHLRAAGRAWVEQTYAWQSVYRQVDAVYAQLLTTDH